MLRRLLFVRKVVSLGDDTERVVVDAEAYSSGIRRNFMHHELLSIPSPKQSRRIRKMTGKR
ncbi:MAG: hypothetical protein ABIH23_24615 [bacterium]